MLRVSCCLRNGEEDSSSVGEGGNSAEEEEGSEGSGAEEEEGSEGSGSEEEGSEAGSNGNAAVQAKAASPHSAAPGSESDSDVEG